MKTILLSVVGSRLHGTATPNSDTDLRGVFLAPIEEILSPFATIKETNWIENDVDNVSYELRHFCRLASTGNPSALEVLVGTPHEETPEGTALKVLLPKFLSERCYDAFMGYSNNQEKKFRQDKDKRKHKYAMAHTRTLYQLLHLLKTGELIGSYSGGVVAELNAIRENMRSDTEIMSRIFQLEGECKTARELKMLPSEPDHKAIEAFVLSCYGYGTTTPRIE